eukprot:2370584-Prymnesium_polylepis.1
MGTLVVSLLPAGRPDRSGLPYPYPIPQVPHTRSREGPKYLRPKSSLQCMPSERNFGSRDGR